MNGAAAHLPEFGRAGAWRVALTWALLLAFALQSYVTQTHVHHGPFAAGPAPIVQVASAAPAGDEAVACPFCQAIAAAGAFFSSPAIAFSVPAVRAEAAALPPSQTGLTMAAAGFSWRSRAPPQI